MEECSINTEGRYQFSNDESEQDRYNMEHAMILNLCGVKLHFGPLFPKKILDAGTGTGIWPLVVILLS
jgi:hypothetical protein